MSGSDYKTKICPKCGAVSPGEECPRCGEPGRGPMQPPALKQTPRGPVWAFAMVLLLTVFVFVPKAFAHMGDAGWLRFGGLLALSVVSALALWGIVLRSRLAFLYALAVTAAATCALVVLAVGLTVLAVQNAGWVNPKTMRPSLVPPGLPAACVSWLLVVLAAVALRYMLDPWSLRWAGLRCPACGSYNVRPREPLFRFMRCARCSAVWR